MNRMGLAIDQTTNDLFLKSDGNLAVVNDAEAVGQHVRQRLMTYSGEWFLDTSAGMMWLRDIMGQAYDPALAEALVKAQIMATDGVVSIETFSVSFVKTQRNLKINNVHVTTDYEEVVKV